MSKSTAAIDLDCPTCEREAGSRCRDGRFCQRRIDAAAKLTRDSNRRAREQRS